MEQGYLLTFTDRSLEQFLKDEFKITLYDTKYDFDFPSKSKANRMRGIWMAEDNKTVGSIILALVEYAENDGLTGDKEIGAAENELIKKAREIGMKLLLPDILENLQQPELENLKTKTELIQRFNLYKTEDLPSNVKIYLLKVYFSYYEAVLGAYYGTGLSFPTSGIDDLNDYFKILRNKIIKIIESDNTFSEIKGGKAYQSIIEPITSLYTSIDFFDGVWNNFTLPQIINLREEIADKDLFENSSEIHKTDVSIVHFFEAVTKEIEKLKGFHKQHEKHFYKTEVPKYKKGFEDIFGKESAQTINHKHVHHFENSIQEKDIAFTHTIFEGDTEGAVIKNKKKVVLPKFPPTPWQQISIRFITDEDVLITTPKKQLSSNYESLGFSNDKEKKPNTAWVLLSVIAKNHGEIKVPKPIPDTLRQQKRQLADQLKLIFRNEQDPFEDVSEVNAYRLKIKLETFSEEKPDDPFGSQEYINETMIEKAEIPGRDFTEF